MKRLAFFVLVVLGIVAGLWLGLWFVVSLYSKSKYDVLLQQDHAVSFAVTPIDQQSKALLSEVQSNWSHRDDRTNSQISGVLTLAGLAPSVRNVIHALQTPMPEFYWWSASRNRQAAMFGLTKLAYSDFGMHQTFHVSDDGHLTLLQCSTDVVLVFQDETNGVREARYFRMK